MATYIALRREQLAAYDRHKAGLMRLFRQCASKQITSREFYDQLPRYWSGSNGNRLQGVGWERSGANSNFRRLSESFIRIIEARKSERDDVVVEEIDSLASAGVPTRGALLSEMLCLRFPDQYPLLNEPVQRYLHDVRFRAPRGVTEGGRYIDLARKLRLSLLQNPAHPAKNLAELDAVIWLEYQ